MDNHTHDLNVPVTSATTSSTRNKVALKPGRSLMDWIRLTHSGKDLAGTGGKYLEISSRELAKHNSRKDAWISLGGKVYNITHYMDYHPGGEDELMRGAGKDATDLFNQVHQWVNAESMLQKCYIGVLKKSWSFEVPKFPPVNLKIRHKKPTNVSNTASKEQVPAIKSKNTTIDPDSCNESETIHSSVDKGPIIYPENECPDALDGENMRRTISKSEWSVTPSLESNTSEISFRFDEDEEYIKLFIDSSIIKPQGLITDLVNNRFFIKLSVSTNYILTFELPIAFKDNYIVETLEHSVKILFGTLTEVKKRVTNQLAMKSPLLSSLQNICWNLCESKEKLVYWSCKLISKIPVNHNTFLFTYHLPPGTKMWVPIGRHVHIKSYVEGIEVVRCYTPVVQSLEDKTDSSDGSKIVLMIKVYPNGVMTNLIKQCNIGENMLISNYSGSFPEVLLTNCDSAIMLAAGTGITPMIRMIHWIMTTKDKMRKMMLMFFNKTEEDILWIKELENCRSAYGNFDIIHVLSEPSENWSGGKGQLSEELIGRLPTENLPDTNLQIFICGPMPFTETALRYLERAGYSKDIIYAFTGS